MKAAEYITDSPEQTSWIGRLLGKTLVAGDVVCISGELGSGKTVFTAGIAGALGVSGYITSPTFCIVNEYAGKLPFCHFDAYRVESAEDMNETGYFDYIGGNGIVVIEWPERIEEILPEKYISVTISKIPVEYGSSAEARKAAENRRLIRIRRVSV
ncbi:MAG: tRNA (adenosine(37)-N6)-threonylcarbamoyltransferase complex ATPase subunit type 1 TsaE [Eubacteriales bacterium]|nr:tRNA (adenosine(37)-N6)-threonylcarbamoyltransferase complex ATPase subunit type 1 TsaE [Eubacteriales bacterium]